MGSLGAYSKQQRMQRRKFSCGSANASDSIPLCYLLFTVCFILPVYCLLATCLKAVDVFGNDTNKFLQVKT